MIKRGKTASRRMEMVAIESGRVEVEVASCPEP
jgi:hypothetical protein